MVKQSLISSEDSINVFYPVPSSIELVRFNDSLLQDVSAPPTTLEVLPTELVTRIFKFLPLTSRINLAISNKRLAQIASENGVMKFDPEALTPSDIELLREIMPFTVFAVLLGKNQTEPMDFWCSQCWITRYAALEICEQPWWIGTGAALNLRSHMKMEIKRRTKVAVINMRNIIHLLRAFVRWEKVEYMRKLNRPAAFLTLKYGKGTGAAGQ